MTDSRTPGGEAPPMPSTASIDDEALSIPASWSGALDVIFDGQRVWSLTPADRPIEDGGVRRFAWPEALRPYLDGFARVAVHEHVTGQVLADENVTFGSGDEPVRVVDRRGRPLAVTKWGRMNNPFEVAGTAAVDAYLDQVEEVLAVLRDDCGLPAFLSYGSLLGAVRGGKLIGHDVDVDLAYLSVHDHPADVMRESFRIERALRRRRWTVRRENGGFLALFPVQPDGSDRNIDVFTCFYVDEFLLQPHDVRARLPRSAILPLGSVRLEGREFPAPADPPALLEATYGTNWRTPDPSFEFKSPPATLRRVRGWLGGLRDHRDHWNLVCRRDGNRGKPGNPSAFAEWVDRCEPEGVRLVDVGCGTGRDALWFARSRRDVLGLDYAEVGIRKARTAAQRRSLPADFELCNLYDLRHVLTMGARLARDDQARVIYCRLLVEALEGHGRHNLWRLAEMALRGGGRLYVEFRAREEPSMPHISGEGIRRLLRPEVVASEIRARGGHVEHLEAGRELARCGDENPYVCRLVAHWWS